MAPLYYNIRVFWIWLYTYFTRLWYIFICFHVTSHHPFISAGRTPFSVSHKAGLMVMNSLSLFFFLIGESLYLVSFRRIILLHNISLVGGLFLFQHIEYINHSLLACGVSAEKSVNSLMGVCLYERNFFSLVFLKFFLCFIQFYYNSS